MFVGSNVSGWIVKQYPAITVTAITAQGKEIAEAPLPNWADIRSQDSAWKYLDLSTTVGSLLFGEQPTQSTHGPDFGAANDTNASGKLDLLEIPDNWIERPNVNDSTQDLTYSGAELRRAFGEIDRNSEGTITREQWRAAQSHNWQKIWIWPALMAGVTSLLFWLGFHDRVTVAE